MFYVLAPKKTKVQIDDNLDIFWKNIEKCR
jgi:hypothetical protein